MKATPLFSIIIPAYNVQDYVARALNSVLNQTFQHFEIILIDDGSIDNTSQICIDYAIKYPQITLLKQPNQGLSIARNHGMQLARGEYLMFLDSDDYWCQNNALENLAQIIENNQSVDVIFYTSILYFSYKQTTAYIDISLDNLTGNFSTDLAQLVNNKIFNNSAWNKVIRREIVLQHQLQFPIGKHYEDFLFSFHLAQHIKTYQVYPQPFHYYSVQRPGAITSIPRVKNLVDFTQLLEQAIVELKQLVLNQHPLSVGLFKFWQENFQNLIKIFNNLPQAQHLVFNNVTNCMNIANELRQLMPSENEKSSSMK